MNISQFDYYLILSFAAYTLFWTAGMTVIVFSDQIAAIERRLLAWLLPVSKERKAWRERGLAGCTRFISAKERI